MSTAHQNLSSYDAATLPRAEGLRIGIVVSDWNVRVTGALLEGAVALLTAQGIAAKDLIIRRVPGSFELAFAAQLLAEHTDVEAILCLGCIIQGETRHFDFVAQGVTQGIGRVSLDYHLPVIFGVLTTETLEQALERSGGRHGNKGTEAAVTALRMIDLQRSLEVDQQAGR
ncbi:MAG TPA: 6,7-dimethyl-8-ribityllumazine synthase [Bacteroidales bacterium]|nr:6,7-dimethyl-8-ribityllumazine synthase [Bacteroidales bacterium]HRZ77348.1 6,7-dimethyl-8-ribityllumazine synthase [Bacteroidales bacterium]